MDYFKKKNKKHIKYEVNELAKKGYNKKHISRTLDISYSSVNRYIDRNIIKKFDEELNKKIIKLYKRKDIGSEKLAKIVGFKSHSTILRRLKKLNIKSKKAEPINSGLIKFNKLAKKNPELKKRTYEKVRESRKGKTWDEIYGKDMAEKLKSKASKRMKGYCKHRPPMSKETKNKISIAKKGIKNPKQSIFMKENNPMFREEERKKASIRSRLSGNPNWLGGISFEPYDKNFNNKFKNSIRKRDNQICMLCNIHREKLNRAFDIHHINYDKKLTIKENVISLCKSCHAITQTNRKHWIILFQNMLSEKYGYKYKNENVILDMGEMHNEI